MSWAPRHSVHRIPISSPRWVAPTTRSSTADARSSMSPGRPRMRKVSLRPFPVAGRAISALHLPRFSGASKAISTPSIPCCSAQPRSSSRRSKADRVFTQAPCITNCSMPRSPEMAASGAEGPTVLVISDQRDWHARQMEAAFAAVGARAERIDLADCGFDTGSPSGLSLPVLGSRLPDAVHVRNLSAGSFEAITKRLGVLHALTELGIVVWNDARAIERCVDKSMTSFLLARAGVPTPPTWTMESAEAARALVEREAPSGPLVLKPLFGAQGKGLRLSRRPEDLPAPEEIAGVYYLQRFQSNGAQDFADYRLFVLRGRVIGAMMRRASTWITNIKQGGQPLGVAPDPKMERLAIAAAEAVGADIAGGDVLVAADGLPTVLEVNSMPAWGGVQKVNEPNIAEAIASALMDELACRPAQPRAS